jgi:hypothetical protein
MIRIVRPGSGSLLFTHPGSQIRIRKTAYKCIILNLTCYICIRGTRDSTLPAPEEYVHSHKNLLHSAPYKSGIKKLPFHTDFKNENLILVKIAPTDLISAATSVFVGSDIKRVPVPPGTRYDFYHHLFQVLSIRDSWSTGLTASI